MKPLFKILAAFAVIIATFCATDYIFGTIADKVFRTKGLTKQQYLMDSKCDYELLFIGSSRANHHYDTPYIADSLGIKAFNGGEDGRGLSYQYPLLKVYLQHNKPKTVILELSPSIDGSWNDRIGMLYPLSNKYNDITSAASLIDKHNKFYLYSSLYRYNSNLISEVRGLLHPFSPKSLGYLPLQKSSPKKLNSDAIINETAPTDSTEYNILLKIIQTCKDKKVNLVGIYSPLYGKVERRYDIDSIFNANNILLIDNLSFRLPLSPEKYFTDAYHLNQLGAREYTKHVIKQLNDSLGVINLRGDHDKQPKNQNFH